MTIKDGNRVVQFAIDLGYTVTPTKRGHWKAVHPCGAKVILTGNLKDRYTKREKGRLRNGTRSAQS
jgi:hypothetical protein